MQTVAEASERILADIARLSAERVPLLQSAGRVLAERIVSPVTIPPWTNSAMDGYAVHGEDVARASNTAPVRLPVAETIAAGAFPSRALGPGEAMRIMTGAPLPEGADTVVRVEDTDAGVATVEVRDARDVGRNLRHRGEDIREGDVVLDAGQPIGAAQVGVLASVGAKEIAVFRRPRVAILGSGDELVDLDRFDEVVAGQKIVSSNSYTLHTLVASAGGVAVPLGNAPDDPGALRDSIRGADGCDLLLTSAGISVGEFDHTRDVLTSLGAEMKFWKVRMRPGAPLGFGLLRGMPWIGLPGNPVSAMVTFELFVRPAIRKMLGHVRLFRQPVKAVLEEDVSIGARLMHFLRAVLTAHEDGRITARLTGPQGSGILTSMSLANALLVVPEDRQRVAAGDVLTAIPLTEDAVTSTRFVL
jgi:molybdopterin molybdotransferase